MQTFAVGQWPAESGGQLEAVEAKHISQVPKALKKREIHRGKRITPSPAGTHPGVLIGGTQFRIFDLSNNADMTALCLILGRIGGGGPAWMN